MLFPAGVGLMAFFDPLRSRGKIDRKPGRWIGVATLDTVPADGVPRQFPVVADRLDAWTRYPQEAIGAVYLRRVKGSDEVQAFSATCPHAGCFVAFQADRGVFQCPCHNSAFALTGTIIQPSPSPRGMDKLETRVEAHEGYKQVLVRYVDFYTGKEKQIPKT